MTDKVQHAPITLSLDALLAAKERRAVRQQTLMARHGVTLVSLTLVTPGPVKDTPLYRRAMVEAQHAFSDLCRQRQWSIWEKQEFWPASGAESMWAVAVNALTIKAATTILEDQHPLGRLWDFDVFCPREGLIGRAQLGHPGRRCFVCEQPAHACSRSRRHPLPELIDRIEGSLHDYFDRT